MREKKRKEEGECSVENLQKCNEKEYCDRWSFSAFGGREFHSNHSRHCSS
jgi:hypothetical protein